MASEASSTVPFPNSQVRKLHRRMTSDSRRFPRGALPRSPLARSSLSSSEFFLRPRTSPAFAFVRALAAALVNRSLVSPRSSPPTQPPDSTQCPRRGGAWRGGGCRGHQGLSQSPTPDTHHADLGADEQVGHGAWLGWPVTTVPLLPSLAAGGAWRRCGHRAGQSGARVAVPPPGRSGGGCVRVDSTSCCGRGGQGSCRPFALFQQHLHAQAPKSCGCLLVPACPYSGAGRKLRCGPGCSQRDAGTVCLYQDASPENLSARG